MLRLSVTDIDGYLWWKGSEDSTVEQLIARLTHTQPPTPQMEAGRAFAKLMEHARDGELHTETVDGWEFRFDDMDGELALPAVRELKGEVQIQTPTGPITLVGKVDGFDGRIYDQKLTERVDPEKYCDSLQWRAYLMMFSSREFVYDIFKAHYRGQQVTVEEHHRMRFFDYPNMREDVARAVCELAEVIRTHIPQLEVAHG